MPQWRNGKDAGVLKALFCGFESRLGYRSVTQDALEYVKTNDVVSITDLKYGCVSLRKH